jgi:flagellar basal body rod protein FlgG
MIWFHFGSFFKTILVTLVAAFAPTLHSTPISLQKKGYLRLKSKDGSRVTRLGEFSFAVRFENYRRRNKIGAIFFQGTST